MPEHQYKDSINGLAPKDIIYGGSKHHRSSKHRDSSRHHRPSKDSSIMYHDPRLMSPWNPSSIPLSMPLISPLFVPLSMPSSSPLSMPSRSPLSMPLSMSLRSPLSMPLRSPVTQQRSHLLTKIDQLLLDVLHKSPSSAVLPPPPSEIDQLLLDVIQKHQLKTVPQQTEINQLLIKISHDLKYKTLSPDKMHQLLINLLKYQSKTLSSQTSQPSHEINQLLLRLIIELSENQSSQIDQSLLLKLQDYL